MKDEIKEILQDVIDDIYQCGEYINQAKKLEKVLDCITNLQKSQETLIKNDNEIITNLQEENERLNNQYDLMENSLDEKQEVIDKSIEYIKDFWKKKSYYEDIDNCMKYATMNEFDKEDLLNILEGSDKE